MVLFSHMVPSLNLDSLFNGLSLLLLSRNSLLAHDPPAPVSSMLLILVVEAIVDSADQLTQLILVLLFDLSKRHDSCSLLVHDSSESGLAFDDGVWDAHLSAEGWEVDDQLNRIDIVGDEDEGSLLVLDQADNVVETVLDSIWLLTHVFLLLALGDGSRFSLQALLLLGFGLWSVFVQELESLGSSVSIESVLELSDRGWNLQSHVENLLLSLESDILWPPILS